MTHLKHCPYPIWMRNLKEQMQDGYFHKCFVYFSEHNRFPYFDHYIHSYFSDIKGVEFMDPVLTDWGTEDWRNKSTNEMLKHSKAEWVGSIEQDWFYKDWGKLWDAIQTASKTADLIGWRNGNYIHPGFWFMKREALEKTNKDFGAHDGYDHFGLITRDAEAQGLKVVSLQDLGFNCSVEEKADCFHQGGINQNFSEGLKPAYQFARGELFYIYNHWSMKVGINQSPLFLDITGKIQERLKLAYPSINPETSEWNVFYK